MYSVIQPQSPYWLYTKNRHEEGTKLLVKIARWNGVEICPKKLPSLLEPMQTGEVEKHHGNSRIWNIYTNFLIAEKNRQQQDITIITAKPLM